jgi:carbon monoxide dehydrogenase subunit G
VQTRPPCPAASSVSEVPRRPLITYRGHFEFGQTPPDVLWRAIEEVDQFETWWSWLEEFKLEGDTLTRGSVLHGVVAPPVPYRMRIRVELTEVEPPHRIDAVVHGDLEGDATLEISESGAGSSVDVAWTVEMMQRPMRMANRFAHPLLQWGHDVVVGITVAGFRRRLESMQ